MRSMKIIPGEPRMHFRQKATVSNVQRHLKNILSFSVCDKCSHYIHIVMDEGSKEV